MWRCVVACAGLVACADVSTPLAFSGPQLAVTQDSSGTHVKSDGVFELDFAPTGAMLPNHLLDGDGNELLGLSSACGAESMIGVLATGTAVEGGSTVASSNLEVQAAGPAVAKIHVTYSVPYMCPDATQLQGSSDFTILPGGRIVRGDSFTPTSSILSPGASCGCGSASDFSATVFYRFASDGATQVQEDGSAVTVDNPKTCSMYANRGVGVSFDTGGDRHVYFGNGIHALSLVSHASQQATDTLATVSAIQVGARGQSCEELITRLGDTNILVGGKAPANGGQTGNDGLFSDDTVHTTAFDIVVDKANHPTAADLPPGWVVLVNLGGADHATITRNPDLGHVVGVPQRQQDGRFYIYFPDGLAAGETITITPQ